MDIAVDEHAEALMLWKMDNPLRKWREAKGWSMRFAAPYIGTSMNSVQDWEQGQYLPSERSFARLKRATKNLQIDTEWMQWWENRPNLD